MPSRTDAEPGKRRGLALAASIAAVSSVLAWPTPALTAERAVVHEVVIQGFQYVPETIKVKRGEVVVWVNKDPLPHTVTASGVFDSKSIDGGQSWRFTAWRAGSFAYVCTLHSNMKGMLQVE